MSKRAAYYDRCRTLYVEEGYSVPAIAAMVKKQNEQAPTRRTIQNWKDDGQWADKRKTFADQTEDLFDITREVAEMAGKNAKQNPNPENINSFVRILSVLRYKQQIRDVNDIEQTDARSKKEQMQEMFTEIQDLMGA